MEKNTSNQITIGRAGSGSGWAVGRSRLIRGGWVGGMGGKWYVESDECSVENVSLSSASGCVGGSSGTSGSWDLGRVLCNSKIHVVF